MEQTFEKMLSSYRGKNIDIYNLGFCHKLKLTVKLSTFMCVDLAPLLFKEQQTFVLCLKP